MEILRRHPKNPDIASAQVARKVAFGAVIHDQSLTLRQKIGALYEIQTAYTQEVRATRKP